MAFPPPPIQDPVKEQVLYSLPYIFSFFRYVIFPQPFFVFSNIDILEVQSINSSHSTF